MMNENKYTQISNFTKQICSLLLSTERRRNWHICLVPKKGTDNSPGKLQLISNINACPAAVDSVRTTLVLRGTETLIVDQGGKLTISNDKATIRKFLDIVRPAAKIIADIAKSQDAEVRDGTMTAELLAREFLKQIKTFFEDGV